MRLTTSECILSCNRYHGVRHTHALDPAKEEENQFAKLSVSDGYAFPVECSDSIMETRGCIQRTLVNLNLDEKKREDHYII